MRHETTAAGAVRCIGGASNHVVDGHRTVKQFEYMSGTPPLQNRVCRNFVACENVSESLLLHFLNDLIKTKGLQFTN
jgi:hypothetical protein